MDDSVAISRTEWLVDVVGVGDVAGASNFFRAGLTLIEHLLADNLILLMHLDKIDVVDFDKVSRDAVVQEAWWEHHTVTLVPEFGRVLSVEHENVSGASETETGNDTGSDENPNHKAGEVDWRLSDTHITGHDSSHTSWKLESHNIEPVAELEHWWERVLSVLALTKSVETEESTDHAGSLGEVVVPEVLEGHGVPQQEGLHSLRHINYLL